EAAAALVLRSPEWHIFGPLSTNVAIGNGFSYAFSDPKFEYGRHLVRGEDTVRFQYHISLENEWTHKDLPNVHLVGMLHHRSGMYGVVSPSKTGSNYIGAALRFDIQ
ncbi:hypothetical protein DAR30_24855, partial [Salmonella enterica subsp. enterica serovar Enteritidis]|nr:hypothetical protein [Salmonella enterica subsp. enterica serovar Enteritidis]